MRALIVLEVEIDDGKRPGTGFARLEWVARSTASFIGYQRRVRRLHSVTVHHAAVAEHLPAIPLMAFEPEPELPPAANA